MTLTLLQLAGTHVAVLAVGYLAGRRAIRRRLQTSEGRQRLGNVRLLTAPHPVVDADTAILPRIEDGALPTRPTLAIVVSQ